MTGVGGKAAIIGIGQTEFSKHAGRSETQLAAEAIRAALDDCGLRPGDVDGLVSYTIDPVEEIELARSVGLRDLAWSSRVPYGGGGSQGVVLHAAAAVASGAATTVVAYRACKSRSGQRFGRAQLGTQPTSNHAGTTATQWCMPYGVITPAAWMSLNASRYMHTFGVTSEDFGRAVVQLRAYAATNPVAHFHGLPITLDDHQQSRWIAEPSIRLFDCCQETDGAVALVVTTVERSRHAAAPVTIAAASGAAVFEEEIATNHYRPDLSVMDSAALLGRRLFDRTGIRRDDIDVAMIYDAFTPVLFMQLEGLGFCEPGEAKHWDLGSAAPIPTNPNGGLIGEGYIHGLNLTSEAVRQLRGTAANQIGAPQRVLVSASRTGVILERP